jgi:hypothetical protein
MILLYILAGIIGIASLGWLILTIGVGIASKEEPDDDF